MLMHRDRETNGGTKNKGKSGSGSGTWERLGERGFSGREGGCEKDNGLERRDVMEKVNGLQEGRFDQDA